MEKTILIYESMDKLRYDSFSNPLVQFLSERSVAHFHIDSCSDASSFSYAQELLSKSEKCLLILIFDGDSSIKGLSPLLTFCMSQVEKTDVLALGRHPMVDKMRNTKKVDFARDYPDLLDSTFNWLVE